MAVRFADEDHVEQLLERRRSIATNEGIHEGTPTVHCPLARVAVHLSHCEQCPRFVQESAGEVSCRLPPDVEVRKAMAGELLGSNVTCLDAELEATRAVELLAMAGVTSAPVLDDNEVLIGVVSSGALAQSLLESGFHFSDPIEVEDAMTTQMVTLPQHASVGEVARVMAERGVDRLPIVTEDGHLVGVVSAMDLVKWLAGWAP
jgi:CBS domain-containing protein